MAEQRQPFRFRLPWLTAAPQPAPAAPRPSQATKTPSQQAGPPTQRPPFRPAGVAPAQPPPPGRAEPPSPSPSSQGTSKPAPQPQEARPSQGSPPSSSNTVTKVQSTSRPVFPAKVTSKPKQATKELPLSPSPSRGGAQPTRPKATTAPPPTPSQTKLPSPTKKPPIASTEIIQYPKELRERETSKTPSDGPQPVTVTVPPPEKPKKQVAFEEPRTKAPTKLVAEVSSPKQDLKPQVKELNRSDKEPKQTLLHSDDEAKKDKVIDRGVIGTETQTKAHPLADFDKDVQQSEKEIFDIKEVFKKTEDRGRDTKNDISSSERGGTFPHKHANAGQKAQVKENLPKFVHKQGAQREKHLLHEKPLSIVTLTGENIGATMHLSSEHHNKERPLHIHRGYKINQDEIAETITGEGTSRKRKSGDTNLQENSATKSYVNNNVQGMNNSLVFNSTVTERNPGVHVIRARNPVESIKPGEERKVLDTHKAEVTSTPAEKLAYAPNIRRRCLRGLLMESSDSDPEKPHRHGCPVGCTQKSKDDTINVQ